MTGYLILVGLIAVYAMAAARLEYLWITGPIVFMVIGFALGGRGASLVELGTGSEIVKVVTELTLALLLFADASSVRASTLRREASVITWLLGAGVPLAVLLGALVAWGLLPALGLAACALLGSILAPTDLSLGLAMFKNPKVPEKVRRAINVESGLNDGLATPFVTLFIGVTIAEAVKVPRHILDAVFEILIGVAVGAAVGVAGGFLVRLSERGWSTKASRQFATLALALLAFGIAYAIGGNGFISAFVGGIAFGALARETAVEAVEYTEATGTLMTFGVWFIFGAVIAPILISDGLAWRPILYAVLSLTVVRILAVAVPLTLKKMQWPSVLFVGWFGPRGLASVVFLIMAVQALAEAGLDATLLAATAGWTILLSVVLHGLSAGPAAAWYGRRAAAFPPGSPELEPATPVKTRQGLASPVSSPITAPTADEKEQT